MIVTTDEFIYYIINIDTQKISVKTLYWNVKFILNAAFFNFFLTILEYNPAECNCLFNHLISNKSNN